VAFITGAARGQGRSHAVRLAEAGADIIAVDICEQIDGVPYPMATEDDLALTVEMVQETGRRIVPAVADVRELDGLAAAVDRAVDVLGRLDIVCANAGITGVYGVVEPKDAARLFRVVVDVNLTGVFNTVEAAKPHLVKQPGGSVIITSSLAGLRAVGAGGGYGEAKHGLVGMMRNYAHELAPHMIRVNTIHPSNVRTPMVVNDYLPTVFRPDLDNPTMRDIEDILSSMNLMPVPWVEPEDISRAVLFLASDDSRYITGATVPVDAGAAIK
jgi:(+)-trans-carveol dehydrogenase